MNKLVERYIQAVAQYLPEAKKSDIRREIRANLMDEIDALASSKGQPLDEQSISDILQRQGHPQHVAQSYAPQYPLVASQDMPLYRTVISKAALLLFVYAILTAGRYLVNEQSVNAFAFLWVVIGSFLDNIGVMLIIITASFYLLGRGGYMAQWRNPAWSPNTLPSATAQRISTSDGVSDVATSVFGLFLLWTPLWLNETAYNNLLLSITPNMEHWRIILTVVLSASLFCAIFRLTQAYWSRLSLGIYILEYVAYGIIMLYLWRSSPLFVLSNSLEIEYHPIIERVLVDGWLVAAIVMFVIAGSSVRKWRNV